MKEANIASLQTAFQELVNNWHPRPNMFVEREKSVNLIRANGDYLRARLRFSTKPPESHVEQGVDATLLISHARTPITTSTISFRLEYAPRGNAIAITDYTKTTPGWTGNGFFNACVSLYPTIIEWLLFHHTDWKEDSARHILIDAAQTPDGRHFHPVESLIRKRPELSGYTQIPRTNGFERHYR